MKKTFLAAAFLACATPAMAIDFATPIMQMDGKTPVRQDDKTILTLDIMVTNVLLASFQDEPGLSGVDKVKRFNLAKRIYDKRKDPTVSADEIALIKTLISKAYNPLLTGRAWEILDPAGSPK